MNHNIRVHRGRLGSAAGWTLAILAVAVLALVPLSIASAEGEDPPAPAWAEKTDERLETCLARELEWYGIQDSNVGKAGDVLLRIEELLAKAQERGYDTGEIEDLLADAQSSLASARSYHAEADRILSAAEGFDSQGKVVDREAAHDTCRTGRDALANARDALLEIRQIGQEIREIVRTWRQAYQASPAPEGS
jgi:hypothetical protein